MEKKLKLYVWENVLRDYTTGIAFALAENPKEARRLIMKKLQPYNAPEFDKEPIEVIKPKAFVVYGGG